MFSMHGIQLLLLATAWSTSGVICDSCSSSCMKNILEVPCVPFRDDYVNVSGVGTYKLHTTAADWDTARNICEQEGGNLAVPNSVAEAKAISTIFQDGGTITGTSNQNYALIGFHNRFREGDYLTIFSQSLPKAGYDEFAPGEPDNLNGVEKCGSINKAGLLNDISCTNLYAFVCELALCNSCHTS